MAIPSRIKTIFRGDLRLVDLPREALRRQQAAAHRRRERQIVDEVNASQARLDTTFASLSSSELLDRFKDEPDPRIWPSAAGVLADTQRQLFPEETGTLIADADQISRDSTWAVAGLGPIKFDAENVWRRDPITVKDWGRDYHADVVLFENDGADVRILWELNRFGHAVTLARAFAVTNDETYAGTFFEHVESWTEQNPYGRGANWNCAMEVALRAVNLLAAFDIFRRSRACTAERLSQILALFDHHGRFIFDNNEFSYVSTSNHYLSDVAGLFWLGTMLPELADAAKWRDLGLQELLSEMDKQVLADGADFESSTGYHRYAAELFLYSFVLAEKHGVEVPLEYRGKLKKMFRYLAGVTRPDGRMPLVGDADGGQFLPIVKRDADETSHLLAVAAVYFEEPEFKISERSSPEVLWLLGGKAAAAFERMAAAGVPAGSVMFPDAGTAVLRDGDLYLHLNANDCGVNGRGSHAHNDALSIEIFAYGQEFVIDPGSYVYNLDREARHRFRSTAYHSTVMIDGVEQNTTEIDTPFVIGNEADPAIVLWEPGNEIDRVAAEQYGYGRLQNPVIHRRTVVFNKPARYWMIEDELTGEGNNAFCFAFHLAPGLTVDRSESGIISIIADTGVRLFMATNIAGELTITSAGRSLNYGHMEATQIISWELSAAAPFRASFVAVPSKPENIDERLALVRRLAENIVS